MKTGFLYGYPNKPVKEYYSYHGMTRECLIQPDPGTFEEFDNEPPYGPEEQIKITNQLQYSIWSRKRSFMLVWENTHGYGTSNEIGINNQANARYVYVNRHFCSYDTSKIMTSWKITRAYIYCQYAGQEGDGGGSIVIQGAFGAYPKYPRDYLNYDKEHYSGNYGSIYIGSGVQIKIWLGAGGIGLINRFGRTKFAMRTSDDIGGIDRLGLNYIYTLIGSSYQYLMVYYKRPLT